VRLRRRLGLLYGILVTLILVMGVWWVYFLNQDARSYEQYRRQHMSLDRLQAIRLLETSETIRTDPAGQLGEVYPFLLFTPTATGHDVSIDPAALDAVRHEARRRQRMFAAEGIFFLLLLAAGTTVLTLAYRSERAFKQARELFLAGATHELKTPLASLRLYLETLERTDLTPADAARIRPRMLEDLERLENLVEQILALGYLDSADPTANLGGESQSLTESLDVACETRQVVADLVNLFERHGVDLQLELPEGLFIRGRSFDFSLALRNLLTNAVFHSPSPAVVRLSLFRDGDWIRLAVRDSGPGIPRQDRERIFAGFVRLPSAADSSRRSRGAGLGLYLVRHKAECLGGRVELASEPGHGSTFTLVLPATDGGD